MTSLQTQKQHFLGWISWS